MVSGFVKDATIAQAKKDNNAARDHCDAQKAMSLHVAQNQVFRAKQRHAESIEAQRQQQLARNQELREASLEMRDYAKQMKTAQIKADSDRIQYLAEIQEQERMQREETKRIIAYEKAQRLLEVQANERAQKLRSEKVRYSKHCHFIIFYSFASFVFSHLTFARH